MNLMEPIGIASIGGINYLIVEVDDFSRYTWVVFICEKLEVFANFKLSCIKLQNLKSESIGSIIGIRSDHAKEFENSLSLFMIIMVSNMSSLLLRLLNRMDLLRQQT